MNAIAQVVLLLIALALVDFGSSQFADETRDYWQLYKAKFNKDYRLRADESYRKRVFEHHVSAILKHNLEADLGLHSYRVGINKYTDWTHDEFKSTMGIKPVLRNTRMRSSLGVFKPSGNDTEKVPDAIDWRAKGLVTPVRDQGKCGSCYTFAAVAVLEAQNAKLTGKLVNLSEQNLVDCSTAQGNEGCNGGLMDFAFDYVIKNKGIATLESYPYEGVDTNGCRYAKAEKGGICTGYVDVAEGDEDALKAAVGLNGPVAVGIDAGSPFFQFYLSGVYSDFFCSPNGINHGVTVVGYGTDPGKKGGDYWLIKNSWGAEWGDKGYIKLARNKANMCGIASMASFPLA